MTDKTNKIARWMTWGGWLIFLALLTMFFDRELKELYNPNQNITEDSSLDEPVVVLNRNKSGHYIAGGRINDQDVIFIIDTGASDVSVPINIAEKLKLKKGTQVRYITANGSVMGYRTVLDKVQLGGIVLRNVRGGINPGMRSNEILLGMTFLKQLEMIQRGNELTLKRY